MAGRPNRINIDLGVYKQPWLQYCQAQGVTPSQAFRQVVARLTAPPREANGPVVQASRGPRIRKQLRLTAGEQAYVAARARQQGFRDTDWIVALVRAHMTQQAQLGQVEVRLLGQSNQVLLGIGRNLNQIARALNGGQPVAAAALAFQLNALRTQLVAHVDSTAKLLADNLARWRAA